MYIDANTQLALQAGKLLHEMEGLRVVVLLPDGGEYARSSKLFKSTLEWIGGGVSMSHLYEGREPLARGMRTLFGMQDSAAAPAKAAEADVHIIINVSTSELLDARKYADAVPKEGSAVVFWNCELDTLRADLGLFGFPPKRLQVSPRVSARACVRAAAHALVRVLLRRAGRCIRQAVAQHGLAHHGAVPAATTHRKRARSIARAVCAVRMAVRLQVGVLHPATRLLQDGQRCTLPHQLLGLPLPRVPRALAGHAAPG